MHRLVIALTAALSAATPALAASPDSAGFARTVVPLLSNTCQGCHNEQLASGGLNLTPYLAPSSLVEGREGWELILRRLRAGEMPPKGVARPPQAEIDALVGYVDGEFERADRNAAPDPGRVTARRLNRAEYSNTVRDLLGVTFHAESSFPTDDSSYGFDTIGSVLSISPVLMEKYLTAAEKIASTAVGADPLPKPFTFEAHTSDRSLRRVSGSAAETSHRIDVDADYVVKIRLAGVRATDPAPLVLRLWVDGALVRSFPIENQPAAGPKDAAQGGTNTNRAISVYDDKTATFVFVAEQEAEARLFLPAGDHIIRAGFDEDEYVESLSRQESFDVRKNKITQTITITGPFLPEGKPSARPTVFACDPRSGTACVQKIVTTLAHRAYRRPVTSREIAALMHFVRMARAQGRPPVEGLQLAIEAILVSPHFLFRIEHDPGPAAGIHRIADIEMASRLSYFLWSSMPDNDLLRAAESGRLHTPEVLHAQVKRMLADPRSAALAENFAGQWLELRNLDVVKPDPEKFPGWGPSLREQMKTETRLFFTYVLRENRPLSDFLSARYTFLNEALAKHYGIPGVTGPEFRKVDLVTDQRGGLLSQGSVLTVSSYPTRTSVVLRGKYVLENILGTPPPPPPPDVPRLDESTVGKSASLRQQMEKHR